MDEQGNEINMNKDKGMKKTTRYNPNDTSTLTESGAMEVRPESGSNVVPDPCDKRGSEWEPKPKMEPMDTENAGLNSILNSLEATAAFSYNQIMIMLGTGIVFDFCKAYSDDNRVLRETTKWLENIEAYVPSDILLYTIEYAREIIADEQDAMGMCEQHIARLKPVEAPVTYVPNILLLDNWIRTNWNELRDLQTNNPDNNELWSLMDDIQELVWDTPDGRYVYNQHIGYTLNRLHGALKSIEEDNVDAHTLLCILIVSLTDVIVRLQEMPQ